MIRGLPSEAHSWRLLVVACGVALLSGACSSNGNTTSSTPSDAPASSRLASPVTRSSALCSDAAALRASLERLTTVHVATGMADEIKNDITDAKAKLATLTDNAKDQWQNQVDLLKASLAELEATADVLRASPSPDVVTRVQAAIRDVKAASVNLLVAVNAPCPSVSPSLGA